MTAPHTIDTHVIYDHEPVNVARWVTAIGDQTDALNAAAAEARATGRGLFMPGSLTLTVEGIVDLRGVINMDMAGVLKVGAAGRIDFGDYSGIRAAAQLRIRRVEQIDRTTQTNPVLRLVGLKGGIVWVDYCDHWEWYANGDSSTDGSISYVTAYLGGLTRQLDFVCEGDRGWITECGFYGGDIKKITTRSSGYSMNQMTFFKPCLERGEVYLEHASRFRFLDARCEYGTKFWFGKNTVRNYVEDSYLGNAATVTPGAVVMEDLGSENVVTTSSELVYKRQELFALDQENTVLDSCADVAVTNVSPGIGALSPTATYGDMVDTGLLPLRGGSGSESYQFATGWRMQRFAVSCDKAAVRVSYQFYDKDQNLLINPPGVNTAGVGTWNVATNSFLSSMTDAAMCVITDPDIAYVRIIIKAGSPVKPFTWLRITGFMTGPSSDYIAEICRRRFPRPLRQASKPTKGAPPVGTRIQGVGAEWVVTDRQFTTLAAEVTGGSSISVASASNIAVGDVLGVVLNTGITHWVTVSGISGPGGTALSLSSAVPSVASAGARVVTARWKSESP